MDTETQNILEKNTNNTIDNKSGCSKKINYNIYLNNLKKYSFHIVLFILFFCLLMPFFILKNNSFKSELNQNDNSIIVHLSEFEEFHFENFDENALLKYRKQLNEFCDNPQRHIIREYEDKIVITNVSYLSQVFQMYVYQNNDSVSSQILLMDNWEGDETSNLLTALTFFSSIKNLKNEEIYVLDIGANIGWYSLFIGKYGYNILSFEPSNVNYYVLKKNYCLNRELNVTFIKKGLYSEEKICDYYSSSNNIGNGIVFCDKQENLTDLNKTGEALLTKLSIYQSFLLKNNLALIKIDVEGMEAKAIEGGIQLITKYHIPFIFLEFSPQVLIRHGTDPRKFLKFFLKNGYNIGWFNFFSDNFLSIDEIMERTGNGNMNLYIVYSKIFKKYKYNYY